MTREDRKMVVFDRVDKLISQLRGIRNKVQKNKHIDPSDFDEVNDVLSSLKHNCEMHNNERVTEQVP